MGSAQTLQLVPGTPPPRVLVVDDDAANRVLLVRLLVPAGFTVREADNGVEAVEVSKEWLPQVVLMDLQMPQLDGFGATRQIKQAPWGLPISVIVISGDTTKTNAADAIAAGALGFIAKPFVESEVLAAVARVLGLTYA